MKDLNLLSLDLELNQPSNTIIQVGAVVGNLNTGDILEEYTGFIALEDETLDERITKLTGITPTDLKEGLTLPQAYSHLQGMHSHYRCFRNPLTWGGGDSELLRTQLHLDTELFLFGRRWIDVKTLFISRCFIKGERHQSGLAKALLRVGLQFKGKKHNACDDALNTFRIYRHLLKESTEGIK